MALTRRITLAMLAAYWVFICMMTHVRKFPAVGYQVGDKLGHFLAFLALASLLYVYLALLRPKNRWNPIIVLAMAIGYGVIDERTQPYFGRTCDFLDWTADCAGACVAVVVLGVLHWGLDLYRRAESSQI